MTVQITSNLEVRDVPLDEIFADSDFNCRGAISSLDVTGLMSSIEKNSLQNPILVRPYSSPEQPGLKYQIVSGFRRFRAIQTMKWPTIPCTIRADLTDIQARILNLTENVDRKELNKLQEAKSIKALILEGMTQEEIARRIGQGRPWVQIRQYLLTLPAEIQIEASKGTLSDAHIRQLYSMNSAEEQYEAVKKIKDAAARGEKIKTLKKPNPNTLIKRKRERPELFALMDHIQEYVGNNLATRALAWAAGEITDNDFFHSLKEECDKAGVRYSIPRHALITD